MDAMGAAAIPGGPTERRQVTVMFTDLVDSTAMASELDPEDVRDILEAYQRRVEEVITQHGGFVSQFQGDGVIAFFGYPTPVEAAGRDALNAGLAVVAAVEALGTDLPGHLHWRDLRARAGIHTGVAVIAATRVGTVDRPADIFGQLPNLAARLQGAAGPGEVVASETTVSLAAGYFDLAPLPPLHLKGIGQPVTAYRVLGRSAVRSRLDAGQLSPFVSRRAEWRWLEGHFTAVGSGPARLVVVTGEAGIGKTRLLHEFAHAIAEQAHSALVAYCSRVDQLSPLKPFGPLMGSVPTDPQAVVEWAEAVAAAGPTLLVIDDAHWADPSTLEVAERIPRSDSPVLVALTARPEIRSELRDRIPGPHTLHLDRLSPPDAKSLVEGMALSLQLDGGVMDALVQRADGVPLYLEELAHCVAKPGHAAVTATLTEVITARLHRLGPDRRVAELAAVIGRDFEPWVLCEVSGMGEQDLRAALERLVDQAIMEPSDVNGGSYRFRHALIQEVAYGALLRADRRQAHARAAAALAAPATPPEVVARHLGEAGRHEEAVELWRKAARLARSHHRFREAAAHEREILGLLPGLPEASVDAVELGARNRLAMCLGTFDQSAPEVLEEATRAKDLARKLGDERAELQASLLLIPIWQAQSDYQAIDDALQEADGLVDRVGDAWLSAALSLLEGGVRVWQGRLIQGLGQLAGTQADIGVPLDVDLRSLPAMAASAAIVTASSRMATALGCWLSGDATTAIRLAEDTLAFAAERRLPPAHAVSAATAAIIAQLDGDRSEVLRLAGLVEESPDEVATLQWRRWAAVLLWWAGRGDDRPQLPGPMLHPYFLMLAAEREGDDPEYAIELLDQADATVRSTGEAFCHAEILRLRARYHHRAGRPDGAGVDLAEAAQIAHSQGAKSLELRVLADRVSLLRQPDDRDRLGDLIRVLRPYGSGPDLEHAVRVLGGH